MNNLFMPGTRCLRQFLSNIGSQVAFGCMQLEGMSGAEYFSAEVARDDDSLKVVCFNMVLNIYAVTLFSAQGTAIG